ncbi:MAG: phosphoglucosamine mutase [Acidobacteriota bacterium]|nr:phosphoglucosamine mutase [Acidobacteriota bacterium]
MPASLFGTDGVRGTPGEPPLDGPTLTRLGAALATVASGHRGSARVFVGRDTRASGEWITGQLTSGLMSQGAQVDDGGVLSTPAVAFLTRDGGYDVGLVVSASHNPFRDNGVKVLTATGEKADKPLEERITAAVEDETWLVSASKGTARSVTGVERYETHTSRLFAGVTIPPTFSVAIDCAHGATSKLAPRVMRRVGLNPVVICDTPTGDNINLDCGSTHPERLAKTVVEQGCWLGAAFDGDGDRVVFVDHRGGVVDGDAVLLIAARRLAAAGRLSGAGVAATVMSNIGLEQALRARGVALHRCDVGDRMVWAEMLRHGLVIGGEQSGHIILGDHLPTGDGVATALTIIRAVIESECELSELAAELVPAPQVVVNVPVRRRVPLDELPTVSRCVEAASTDLGPDGRVLVRYSGTEALLRIMVEGPTETHIRRLADTIAEAVRAEIGK